MMNRSTNNILSIKSIVNLDSAEKWLRVMLAVLVMISLLFIGFAEPVSAAGAIQISGVAHPDTAGECTDMAADLINVMTGDLEGCLYIFVETFQCSPSGTYRETGREVYVLDGPYGEGTFSTTYRFESKFEGCSEEGFPLGAEIFGRCQHPIVAGSGTGDYEGVTGRLSFKDDIAAGNFPYRGHLKW